MKMVLKPSEIRETDYTSHPYSMLGSKLKGKERLCLFVLPKVFPKYIPEVM